MKTNAIICAFLAITANAGPLNRRQAAGGTYFHYWKIHSTLGV
jgi:hypothetical protein